MNIRKNRVAAVAVGAFVLVGFSSMGAMAAGLITSAQIKDQTIRSSDIATDAVGSSEVRDSSILPRDLSDVTVDKLQGATGAKGAKGDTGPMGPAGAAGTAKYVGANWSIIDRNVEGGGDAYLRSGPAAAPLGIGSLGIRTGSGTDKTAFGNEVDFSGQNVADLTTVSYDVFTTGENVAKSAWNIPSVTFEIDPNLASSTSGYSSLVFASDKAVKNKWTTIDATDATQGFWFLTGDAGVKTGCTQSATPCSFDDVMQQLNDGGEQATIYTAAITKGKDYAFSGAVDKLVINNTTYDFEPFGVSSN